VVTSRIKHKYHQICSNTAYALQKCDAKHPCITCINAHRAAECEYEIDDTPPSPFDRSQFLFWDGPGPLGSKDVYRREAVGDIVSEPPTSQPLVSVGPRLPPEIVPPDHALICPIADSLLSYGPRCFDEITKHNLPRAALPPFSAIPSLVFPGILPGPHVTLPPLRPGGFQLSDISLGELNMKLYVS
jgi:hypothetical protein